MPDYTKEQFWKLYEKLPEELKDAIFSEETANNISSVCERNKVEIEKVSEVARYTGRVLLGVLPPDEFQKTLEKKVGFKKEIAKKVAQEINRFILFPVKESLAALYKTEIAPPAGGPAVPPSAKPSPHLRNKRELGKPSEAAPPKETPEKPDVYREFTE